MPKVFAVTYFNGETRTRTFQPPFPWRLLDEKSKKTNSWLSKFYHGLQWRDGTIPYEQMESEVKRLLMEFPDATIYVAGPEQKKCFGKINVQTVDLQDEFECPGLRKLNELYSSELQHDCEICKHGFSCASLNSMLLHYWSTVIYVSS